MPDAEMSSNPRPVGVQMPGRIAITAPAGAGIPVGGAPQSVMIHAEVNGEGKVVEEELSATGYLALTRAVFGSGEGDRVLGSLGHAAPDVSERGIRQ